MSTMDVSNLNRETLIRMFNAGKRFDGRGLLDLKDFHVEYGVSNKAEGSARVKLGKTEVVVGVKLSPGEPYPDSMDSGNLIVSGDLLPLASPRFESGPPGFNGIELPRLIDRMVRESGAVDLTKLCIEEGKKVWNVFIDIYPINDDGALIDAASIATIAALHMTKIPKLNDEGTIDYEKEASERFPLSSETRPISFTFFKLGNSLILHPTREEEEACDGKVVFGISKWNKQYMINACQKALALPLTQEEIEHIAKVLPGKYDEVMEKLKKHLK